jgi:hypothetical protein
MYVESSSSRMQEVIGFCCNLTDIRRKPSVHFSIRMGMVPESYHQTLRDMINECVWMSSSLCPFVSSAHHPSSLHCTVVTSSFSIQIFIAILAYAIDPNTQRWDMCKGTSIHFLTSPPLSYSPPVHMYYLSSLLYHLQGLHLKPTTSILTARRLPRHQLT